MAPPMERDDREPGRQRGRERLGETQRQREAGRDREGTRRHTLGLGLRVSEEGASRHIVGLAIETEQDKRAAVKGWGQTVGQGEQKRREGGRCGLHCPSGRLRRDKRRAQAAATGPV